MERSPRAPEAIDDSIARRAETEFLYDQPYEDSKRIRVTGPFTVESLSPHRVLAPEAERPATEAAGERDDAAGSFVNIVLDNLRKAGVQNTVKQERLVFDRLEPYRGLYLQASDAERSRSRVDLPVCAQRLPPGRKTPSTTGNDPAACCGMASAAEIFIGEDREERRQPAWKAPRIKMKKLYNS